MKAGPSNDTIAITAGRPHGIDEPLNYGMTLASNFHGEGYARCNGTPQWRAFESTVAEMEGAGFALAFSSGMAAVSGILYALRPKVIVAPRVCYLGVRALLNRMVDDGHVQVHYMDITNNEEILSLLPNCDLLWLESPTNPMLQVAQLPTLLPQVQQRFPNVRIVVDATFATPMSQTKPLSLGATVVMHSATKFIAGHSDAMMGVAVVSPKAPQSVVTGLLLARDDLGATPGVMEAFLALRGLRTLPVRYARASESAAVLVERLKKETELVERVFYPGEGAMISFVMRGGRSAADCMCNVREEEVDPNLRDGVRVIVGATSLGGVETTMERREKYASESHIDPGLIRMSVGLEDVEDIWTHLQRRFRRVRETGANRPVIHIPHTSRNVTLKHSNVPVAARCQSGDVIAFETTDENYEKLSLGQHVDLETVNIVTGPLHVEHAKAGDILRVHIIQIDIRRCWSVWDADPQCSGCLARKLALAKNDPKAQSIFPLAIDSRANRVRLSDRMSVPIRPMIGCIATASADETYASSTFEPTYCNGGNMDMREMEVGSSVDLPVLVDGALLYVGDLHACMGQGEPTWVGFEAAGVATLRVELIKTTKPLPWPRLMLPGGKRVFTCVAETHNRATQGALEQAYDFLTETEGLTPVEAHTFLTALGDARFGGPASIQAIIVIPDPKEFFKSR